MGRFVPGSKRQYTLHTVAVQEIPELGSGKNRCPTQGCVARLSPRKLLVDNLITHRCLVTTRKRLCSNRLSPARVCMPHLRDARSVPLPHLFSSDSNVGCPLMQPHTCPSRLVYWCRTICCSSSPQRRHNLPLVDACCPLGSYCPSPSSPKSTPLRRRPRLCTLASTPKAGRIRRSAEMLFCGLVIEASGPPTLIK